MLQKTHSFAGLLAAEGAVLYMQNSPFSWESAAALLIGCLAGPLADIDKQGSTMAKIFFPAVSLFAADQSAAPDDDALHIVYCRARNAVLVASAAAVLELSARVRLASAD